MNLFDAANGNEVASAVDQQIILPDGRRYVIEGFAVVDVDGIVGEQGAVVGTFDDNSLWNKDGKLMAVTRVDEI